MNFVQQTLMVRFTQVILNTVFSLEKLKKTFSFHIQKWYNAQIAGLEEKIVSNKHVIFQKRYTQMRRTLKQSVLAWLSSMRSKLPWTRHARP